MKTRLALGVGVVALLAVGWATGLYAQLSPDAIRALVERAGWWGPLAFVALFVVAELAQLPGSLLVLVAAALWPPAVALATAYAGALAAALLFFWLSRTIFAGAVSERLPPWLARHESRLETHGLVTVIGLRLVLFLAPWVHWLLGASRVSFRDYALGSALGLLPGLVVVTFLGHHAIEHWDGLRPWALGAVALLLALELARRVRARQSEQA